MCLEVRFLDKSLPFSMSYLCLGDICVGVVLNESLFPTLSTQTMCVYVYVYVYKPNLYMCIAMVTQKQPPAVYAQVQRHARVHTSSVSAAHMHYSFTLAHVEGVLEFASG